MRRRRWRRQWRGQWRLGRWVRRTGRRRKRRWKRRQGGRLMQHRGDDWHLHEGRLHNSGLRYLPTQPSLATTTTNVIEVVQTISYGERAICIAQEVRLWRNQQRDPRLQFLIQHTTKPYGQARSTAVAALLRAELEHVAWSRRCPHARVEQSAMILDAVSS